MPQADVVEHLRKSEYDGILAQLDHDGPILDYCRSAKEPVVDLVEAHPELNIPRVILDEAAIGRMVGEHFVERGFRHFAFCSAYDHYALAGRLQGFRDVVEPGSESFHVIESRPGNLAAIPGPDAIAQELQALPLPLAVMALDDASSQLVVDACEMAGLLVPEQVAVAGCNNDEHCEACKIRLSSVVLDPARQVTEAAGLLGRLMDGEPPPDEPIRIPPVALAVRESSDIFAVENVAVARAVQHIIQRWREPGLCVDDVAAVVGFSRSHIEGLFRRYLDSGVAEYIRNMRIQQLRNLLQKESWPIKRFAEYGGFVDAAHFSKVFKKSTGLSPSAWRKEHRERDSQDTDK